MFFNPLTPGKFVENDKLKPYINAVFGLLWRQITSKLSKTLAATWKLSFFSTRGQIDRLLVSGMRTKQNFEKKTRKETRSLTFCFFRSTPRSFSFYSIFPLVAGLSLGFIYEVKFSQQTLKKAKLFNKRWQVVGRPDFSLILPVKTDRFFACKSIQFTRSLSRLGTF